MDSRFAAGAAALLVVGAVASCSDPEPAARPAGGLPAGTAEVSIGGAGPGTTNAVSCTTTGTLTTINTGDENSGTTSSIDSTEGLTLQYTEITNVGGFTGSYWADLGPAAEVEMTAGTYLMTGSATGFKIDNPSARTSETFSIRVAC
ncbi:lipoprotein LpqH [Mycobacterium hubeiense]|uniref:lipoprotein LpqH n=1 Tax=Mycobacterium hubeiense TaxID=1867256 RepID=UPI0021012BCB|nr:lipoprotein LpqH [Mycobacterium sp. QGD 101]